MFQTSNTLCDTSANALLFPENAAWLFGRDKLNIVMTRIEAVDNIANFRCVAVIVKSGYSSIKLKSDPCMTELEALQSLYLDLAKSVGKELYPEGEFEATQCDLNQC